MPHIRFHLNGAPTEVDADPDGSLLDLLRGRLGLTGPHFGCGGGECGACRVLVGDHAVTSCDTPLWSVADKEVTTLEGLGNSTSPHPVQQAFIDENAAQCGYCLNGMIMTVVSLALHQPDAGEAEIKNALAHNLCRCGSQNRMVRAILRAANEAATT